MWLGGDAEDALGTFQKAALVADAGDFLLIHKGAVAQGVPAKEHHPLVGLVVGRHVGEHAAVEALVVAAAVEVGWKYVVAADLEDLVVQKGLAVGILKAG